MIVVEGADLVGKSTLVKALVAELREQGHNYATCHLGLLAPGDRCGEYLDLLCARQVWDRFHMSELAYGAVDEREKIITPSKYHAVDAHLFEVWRCHMIVITASNETLERRYDEKGDDVYDLDHIKHVNSYFEWITSTRRVTAPQFGDDAYFKPRFTETADASALEEDLAGFVHGLVRHYLEGLELGPFSGDDRQSYLRGVGKGIEVAQKVATWVDGRDEQTAQRYVERERRFLMGEDDDEHDRDDERERQTSVS